MRGVNDAVNHQFTFHQALDKAGGGLLLESKGDNLVDYPHRSTLAAWWQLISCNNSRRWAASIRFIRFESTIQNTRE